MYEGATDKEFFRRKQVSHSAMREALGCLRECLDVVLGNQLIKVNPCLIVEVPWTFKQSKKCSSVKKVTVK